MREWIGPALASPDLVLDAQPPAQPHSGVIVDRPIRLVDGANTEVYAVRALCKARSMPHGRMKQLQLMAGRIYDLLKKEAAYSPNTQHLEDFRAAQKLERSIDSRADVSRT